MPIKNYTSKQDVFDSLGAIQGALGRAGAERVMVNYANKRPVSVTFAMETVQGTRGFLLPAPVAGTLQVMKRQGVKCDEAQAERTAWKNAHDWVMAQLALVESCNVQIDEVFLPYMVGREGKTLYEAYTSGQLMLGDGANG